jgi:hypothetical protein
MDFPGVHDTDISVETRLMGEGEGEGADDLTYLDKVDSAREAVAAHDGLSLRCLGK